MRFEGHYLKAEKFQELHTSLSESIKYHLEGDLESIFINKLTYLNQHTLKKRITEILIFLNGNDLLEWNRPKRKSFAKYVGDQRDALTHYENIDNFNFDYIELLEYVNELKTILASCLKYEISKSE